MKKYRKAFLLTGLNIGFLLVLWAYPYVVEPLSIQPDNKALNLVNNSRETLYFAVVGRDRLAQINWSNCERPEESQDLAPEQSEVVFYRDIADWRPGADVVVSWWRLEKKPNGNGFQVIDFASKVVATPSPG